MNTACVETAAQAVASGGSRLPQAPRFLLVGVCMACMMGRPQTPPIIPPSPVVITIQHDRGIGETVYLTDPQALIRAIRQAEGVPSYGVMWLARRYKGHHRVPEHIGRREAARIVHRAYRDWVNSGKEGDFLVFLRDRYAPLGADNDPTGLNDHWLTNVTSEVRDGR